MFFFVFKYFFLLSYIQILFFCSFLTFIYLFLFLLVSLNKHLTLYSNMILLIKRVKGETGTTSVDWERWDTVRIGDLIRGGGRGKRGAWGVGGGFKILILPSIKRGWKGYIFSKNGFNPMIVQRSCGMLVTVGWMIYASSPCLPFYVLISVFF